MPLNLKYYLSLLLIFLIKWNAYSQNSNFGNWFIYFGNQKIAKKWNWWNEAQYRNYNFIGDLQQLVLRTGIGYNLTENNNNVLIGYGFINSQRYVENTNDKIGSNEHRIYQQFVTFQNFGRVLFQHRYRIEERFLKDDFQMRLRYLLSFNIPLNNKTLTEKTLYTAIYNELFVNTRSSIFDRNRLYLALGYYINRSIRMELGFMAQTLENSNRNQLQIVLFNSLPIWKPKPSIQE